MASQAWLRYVRERYPAYLLPESALGEVTTAEATRFFEALTGRADAFDLVKASSFIASRASQIKTFVESELVHLVANLPSRSEVRHREWHGGYHGRLHVAGTLAHRLEGRRANFVTVAHRRSFDLGENVVVRFVCARLHDALKLLRESYVIRGVVGWGAVVAECEGTLRRLLSSSRLREVTARHPNPRDHGAARSARHTAYHTAAALLDDINAWLDTSDPHATARLLAEGALFPVSEDTLFELAVLMRLAESLGNWLATNRSGPWMLERAALMPKRRELFSLSRDDLRVRLFFNQAIFGRGPADEAASYYFGTHGRLRPDITVTLERGGQRVNAVIVECKNSEDPEYLHDGYRQAFLYANEYASELRGPIKVILVVPGSPAGAPRTTDDVLATGWSEWAPANVAAALFSGT